MILHVWSFSVLSIEVVVSGQLAESFFLSGITDLWAVFCRFVWCLVFVVDLITLVCIMLKEIAHWFLSIMQLLVTHL